MSERQRANQQLSVYANALAERREDQAGWRGDLTIKLDIPHVDRTLAMALPSGRPRKHDVPFEPCATTPISVAQSSSHTPSAMSQSDQAM